MACCHSLPRRQSSKRAGSAAGEKRLDGTDRHKITSGQNEPTQQSTTLLLPQGFAARTRKHPHYPTTIILLLPKTCKALDATTLVVYYNRVKLTHGTYFTPLWNDM